MILYRLLVKRPIQILILLPNSPQAGSDMLNNMIASFTASNQIGEAMKAKNELKTKRDMVPREKS
jgi:hypothetical protein